MRREQLKHQDDNALVARIRERRHGWRQAFCILAQRHREGVLRYCQVRLGNRQDAEDAVQESMLRAHRGMAGFKGDAGFHTWLYAIAGNQCKTLAIRRGRHILGNHLRERIALHESQRRRRSSSPATDPRVHKTLAGMPQSSRDVLMLRFFGELSIEEIARTLGIGLSATKMRLYRAQERFADDYAQDPAA